MRGLPSGTVTFLFTDIEGSTKLLRQLGEEYGAALAEHRRLFRETFARYGGVEVDTQGDAFFVAFDSPTDAVEAAGQAQSALGSGPIRVRMGVHTAEPTVTDEGYIGLDVHKGARIAASGHGGQVIISADTRAHLDDAAPLIDLGEHQLKDFDEAVQLFQLGEGRFPPLRTISNTNLPRPTSSFVGRQREVAEILSMLRHTARFITLTGPGGSGKTRLGIEVASELIPEPGRVVLGRAGRRARPGTGATHDRPDAGCRGRSDVTHRRAGDAAASGQLRAGHRGRGGPPAPAGDMSQPGPAGQ